MDELWRKKINKTKWQQQKNKILRKKTIFKIVLNDVSEWR